MTPEIATNERPSEQATQNTAPAKKKRPMTPERARIRELTQQALDAFRRDLPQLMQEAKWKWVAFHGDRQVAWGQRQLPVILECRRLGFTNDEVMIRSVEPEWAGGEYILTPLEDEE